MEKDLTDQEVEQFLSDSLSDSDLEDGIHTVSILFSQQAIPRLLDILQSQGRSFETRKQAAFAIRDIGAESIIKTLSELQVQGSPQLRDLAEYALSYVNQKK